MNEEEKGSHNLRLWALKNQYNGEKWAKKPPMFPIVCVNAERACHRYLCQTAFLQMHRPLASTISSISICTHSQKMTFTLLGFRSYLFFRCTYEYTGFPSLSCFCAVVTLYSSFNLFSSCVILIAIKLFHPNNFSAFCCYCLCVLAFEICIKLMAPIFFYKT